MGSRGWRSGARKGRKRRRLSHGVIKTLKVPKSPQTARNLQTRSFALGARACCGVRKRTKMEDRRVVRAAENRITLRLASISTPSFFPFSLFSPSSLRTLVSSSVYRPIYSLHRSHEFSLEIPPFSSVTDVYASCSLTKFVPVLCVFVSKLDLCPVDRAIVWCFHVFLGPGSDR